MPAEPIDPRAFIRDVPDFPRPGVLFKDITPLLADPGAFAATIDGLARLVAESRPEVVAAAEARGFLFAAPLALRLGIGLVPIRKPGKLPHRTVAREYLLEYGSDRLEVHRDAIAPGHRVLLVDDVLATGGTMRACCDLVAGAGATVAACAFVIELASLKGREKLEDLDVYSLITY
ncbi:MAG TPA: adenine phosphoribosyltransferase [Isosphaeraceae bacterium]|jgi:adenine phosphoribosyltransferase|nr:adenine phosphoribosyltransferase [Isosphaeraceae bacterium]